MLMPHRSANDPEWAGGDELRDLPVERPRLAPGGCGDDGPACPPPTWVPPPRRLP